RKNNGCTSTGVNSNDFVIVGPIPRNSTAPPHACGGDPAQISGVGIATPGSLVQAANTLLTVKVTPALTPGSTGLTARADLTSIGGSSVETLYDDGTHGDQTANDNIFSVTATVGAAIPTGVKYMVATVS